MDNNAKLSNAAKSVMSTWVERPNELKERLFISFFLTLVTME